MVDFDVQTKRDNFQGNANISTAGYDIVAERQRILLGTEEIKKELAEKFEKKYANAQIFPASIAALHPDIVDFLLSFNLVSVYDNMANQANLDANGRNILPNIVWEISVKKSWDSLDQILESRLPLVHSSHVLVAQLLNQNILDKARALSEKPVVQKNLSEQPIRKEIQISLSEALLAYPKIGEQNITSEQIKLRFMPTLARPSIKNWITDFHDAMGSMKHSPIDRGNFLFHSENGKKLSANDRQRLGTILKSLDEQTLLSVNAETQSVVFENTESQSFNNQQSVAAVQTQGRSPISSMSANSYSHDVFGDLSTRPENETILNKQFENKVQDFFAKPANENISKVIPNYNNIQPMPMPVPPVKKLAIRPSLSAPIHQDAPRDRLVHNQNQISAEAVKPDNYFSIPQSKPPIGSEHFNVEQTRESSAIKPRVIPSEVRPQIGSSDSSLQNRDTLSDDLLYKMIQEKKIKQPSTSQNPISSAGSVSFSSPQKLPTEQIVQPVQMPAKEIQPQPVEKINQIYKPTAKQAQRSPYHITPSDYSYAKNDDLPVNQKNVVNLKN